MIKLNVRLTSRDLEAILICTQFLKCLTLYRQYIYYVVCFWASKENGRQKQQQQQCVPVPSSFSSSVEDRR